MSEENLQNQVEVHQDPKQLEAVAHASGQVALADIRPGEEGRFPDTVETHDLSTALDFSKGMNQRGFELVGNEPTQMLHDRRSMIGGLVRKHGDGRVKSGPAINRAGDKRLHSYRSVYVNRSNVGHAA